MTDDKIALRALLEKGSDTTFLREMIGFAAERISALKNAGAIGMMGVVLNAQATNEDNWALLQVAQALGGHQPAVGGAAGEDGVLRPEEHPPDGGVDAVGADEQVDLDRRAVLEGRLDAVAVIGEPGQQVADVEALGRQRADERAEQSGEHDAKHRQVMMRAA